VRDTGIGIPADRQQAVFAAFEQADASTHRQYGGTGLGLAISARLVERMGGRITVESAPGRGSTFTFTLPLEAAPAEASAVGPAPAAAPPRPLRVLLAEDNAVNQAVAAGLLRKHGHAVTTAADGREALAAWERGAFDVILMDVQMPDLDGLEATALLRQREATHGGRVPVVALTAYALMGDRERCVAAGMDDYLAKPVREEELLAVLARFFPGTGKGTGAALAVENGHVLSPALPAPAAALVDAAAIRSRYGDVPGLLSEIVGLFAADCPQRLAELRGALTAGDARRAERAAHAVKGAVGNFFAATPGATARRIEELARAGDVAGAEALRPTLEAQAEALAAELAALAAEDCAAAGVS
jgi:CheY-like chemotaxis protein/HPt (histidine-containing phosphotransfer) domain-containing protein